MLSPTEDFSKHLERVRSQRLVDSNELLYVHPTLPAFIRRNKRLWLTKPISQISLRGPRAYPSTRPQCAGPRAAPTLNLLPAPQAGSSSKPENPISKNPIISVCCRTEPRTSSALQGVK
jgi:hypothetical protein